MSAGVTGPLSPTEVGIGESSKVERMMGNFDFEPL